MKKLIIAFIALLILGGGGFGAYLFFNKPAEATETQEAKKEEEKDVAAAAPPSFVEMKPLVLPVVDKQGVSQIISIVISLETDDPAKVEEIKMMQPRLTDAYIQGMYGVLNSQAVMADGVLQVNYIKGKLNSITTKVMGKDKVKDVLLQVVQQRPT